MLVLDYFCGVVSVCFSCRQWIMQKFMRMSVCQSQPVCLFVVEDCKFTCENIPVIDVTALASTYWGTQQILTHSESEVF